VEEEEEEEAEEDEDSAEEAAAAFDPAGGALLSKLPWPQATARQSSSAQGSATAPTAVRAARLCAVAPAKRASAAAPA
jgi:hypothetical protein